MKPWSTPSIKFFAVRNAQVLRVLKVGAVQDPQILQVQRVFQSNEPQNTRSTAVFQSIEPQNTPSTSSIESDHTRNTPSTSIVPEYRALKYSEYTKYLNYVIISDARYFTPRYSEHLSAPSHIHILRESSGLCSGRPNLAHCSVDDHQNYSRSSCRYVSYGIYILRYHCCCRLHHARVWDEVSWTSFSFHDPTSTVAWPLLWHLDLTDLILSIKVITLTTVHSDISASDPAGTLCTRGIWILGTTHTRTYSQHSGSISRFEVEYCSHSQSLAMLRPQAP